MSEPRWHIEFTFPGGWKRRARFKFRDLGRAHDHARHTWPANAERARIWFGS